MKQIPKMAGENTMNEDLIDRTLANYRHLISSPWVMAHLPSVEWQSLHVWLS